jgi:chorismate synthase
MLRFLTGGESHGKALIAFLEGMPAGLPIDVKAINEELSRRQKGYGRSNRQKIEKDEAQILSGIRHGTTTGAPIAIMINNRDFENWQHVMSVAPLEDPGQDALEQLEKKSIRRFRPGHADLAGTLKFRHADIRDVVERSSARETAARVAIGAICQQLLNYFGIRTVNHVLQIADAGSKKMSQDLTLEEIDRLSNASDVFCLDEAATAAIKERIDAAWQSGDTLGGIVEVIAEGVPVGLGSYTQWDSKIDGKLAQALMSIQAIKAVEIGDGLQASQGPGSKAHDALYPQPAGSPLPFTRRTNHAGGLEGGMTNGERVVVRAYMKPIPTLREGLDSLSFPEFAPDKAHYERSDVCAVPAASVVCKAMLNIILAQTLLDKFGGDNIKDIEHAFAEHKDYCRKLKEQMAKDWANSQEKMAGRRRETEKLSK